MKDFNEIEKTLDFGAAVVLKKGLPNGMDWPELNFREIVSIVRAVDSYKGADALYQKALLTLESMEMSFDAWTHIQNDITYPRGIRVLAWRKTYTLADTVKQKRDVLQSTDDPAVKSELMAMIIGQATEYDDVLILYQLTPDTIQNPDKIKILYRLSKLATDLKQADEILRLAKQFNPILENEMLSSLHKMVGQP